MTDDENVCLVRIIRESVFVFSCSEWEGILERGRKRRIGIDQYIIAPQEHAARRVKRSSSIVRTNEFATRAMEEGHTCLARVI